MVTRKFLCSLKDSLTGLGCAAARTPPACFYTDPGIYRAERESVFRAETSSSWHLVAYTDLLTSPGDYVAAEFLDEPLLVVRQKDHTIRAFVNICRHHAAVLAGPSCRAKRQHAPSGGVLQDGRTLTDRGGLIGDRRFPQLGSAGRFLGSVSQSGFRFVCPYHGWQYSEDGRLALATEMRGIEDFRPRDYGLLSLPCFVMAGRFVWVRMPPSARDAGIAAFVDGKFSRASTACGGSCRNRDCHAAAGAQEQRARDAAAVDFDRRVLPASEALQGAPCGDLSGLRYCGSRTYRLACNWKVFVDNYLDGGCHVKYAHPALAAQLEEGSYRTFVRPEERMSVQTCQPLSGPGRGSGEDPDRIGGGAVYVYMYPHVMINRYGHAMDVNIVVPTGPDTCDVVFDFFFEEGSAGGGDAFDADRDLAAALAASDAVQQEDGQLCARVMAGLRSESSVYATGGRYVPSREQGMHAFHVHLVEDMLAAAPTRDGAL
eukprot:TRINITY_DN1923_c0_g2_i1.p1 TRINITY_DN1923_c0_g2~~TRINITY_DN1923_c0_g2_i1.p1  ORF type:complete len:487 (-),score=71.15 TRINITY_DN1923_c0_g2_i1:407-1867(-)